VSVDGDAGEPAVGGRGLERSIRRDGAGAPHPLALSKTVRDVGRFSENVGIDQASLVDEFVEPFLEQTDEHRREAGVRAPDGRLTPAVGFLVAEHAQ
jgi:hypothetical protein